jgi:hypothetical protein
MIADNPAPDNDTMESLIDTNEQLQTALNHHQRAILGARKQLGIGERSNDTSPVPVSPETTTSRLQQWVNTQSIHQSSSTPPPALPDRQNKGGKGKETDSDMDLYEPPQGPPKGYKPPQDESENPFKDPEPSASGNKGAAAPTIDLLEQRLAFEPFHPGFDTKPSYQGRQESALDNVAMHGAGSGELTDAPKPPPKGDGKTLTKPLDAADENDDDLYESTPKKKEPMYRY